MLVCGRVYVLNPAGHEYAHIQTSSISSTKHKRKHTYTHTPQVLRLYPSVPKEGKWAYQDDVLPDGTRCVVWFPFRRIGSLDRWVHSHLTRPVDSIRKTIARVLTYVCIHTTLIFTPTASARAAGSSSRPTSWAGSRWVGANLLVDRLNNYRDKQVNRPPFDTYPRRRGKSY